MSLRLLQHRSDSGERAVIAAQGDTACFVPGFTSIRALALHAIAQGIDLAQAVANAGRDLSTFEITAYAVKLAHLETLEEAGVDRAVFSLPALRPDVVVPKLDEWAAALSLS